MSPKIRNSFENIALIIFCILNLISPAFSSCSVRLPDDISLRPNFFLKVGSHKIQLMLTESDTSFSIFDNQEVEAVCKTKFQSPESLNDKNKFNINCNSDYNQREFDYNYNFNYGNKPVLTCSSENWNLYETLQNFVWCPSNTTSYILARPKSSEVSGFEYFAGICYDTYNPSFKSLYYTISPKHSKYLQPTFLTEVYKPGLELKYLKQTFGMKSVRATDYDNQDIRDWIEFSQYNYSSVMQNALVVNELTDQLGSMLELVWWPNLRLRNWKRFEDALTRHIERQNQSYDVITGISGTAKVPIIEGCQINYTLKHLIDKRNQHIPMYMWSYLRSTSNSSDEVVVIGVNSPFYEFYEQENIKFCPDKCQQIPWLKNASITFRFSALGVIFCCSSEDVRTSKRLDGFPEIDMGIKPQGTTQTAYANAEETTINYDSNYNEKEYD